MKPLEFVEYTSAAGATDCAGLGPGWRLPTIKELVTLVDRSSGATSYLDPTAFPGEPTDVYCSITPVFERNGTTLAIAGGLVVTGGCNGNIRWLH